MARRRYRPTLRTRRLSAELLRLREAAGMTIDQAGEKLRESGDGRWSRAKVGRMESAQFVQPTVHDIRDMLDAYEVTDESQREALIGLVRRCRERGWWTEYEDVFTGAFVAFEAEATHIKTYEPSLVPGLLQTERYAEAIFRGGVEQDPDSIARRVAARMARKQALQGEHAPELWAIVDEAALIRPIGSPAIMREQIEHLLAVTNERITVQVLRLRVGAHPGTMGGFVLLSFEDPDDLPVVHAETATESLLMERREQVRAYSRRFDHLIARAEGPPESRAYLRHLLDRLPMTYDPAHELPRLEPGAVEDVEPHGRLGR